MLAPNETDPNDKAAAKPAIVPAARADRTPARVARDVRPSPMQERTKSDVPVGKPSSAGNSPSAGGNSPSSGNSTSTGKSASADKPAPSDDTTLRTAAVGNSKLRRAGRAIRKWARRAFLGLLIALCSG